MEERVEAIAWHRLTRLIDLHQGDAMGREVKRRADRAQRNGAGQRRTPIR